MASTQERKVVRRAGGAKTAPNPHAAPGARDVHGDKSVGDGRDHGVDRRYLLTAAQMAQFTVDGFLLFDGFVPRELNEAVYADQVAGKGHWNQSEATRQVFELPQVKGILQSLLGKNPVYDHSALHIVGPQQHGAQFWHADSIIDTRPYAFDVQTMYFSHDVPKETGPTLVLPGSHLRRASNMSIARYKNIVGQKQLAGSAGTIGFMHQAIWHCAQPNYTDATRYMFKLRLRAGEEQRGLFNTEGYDTPEVRRIVAGGSHPWMGDQSRAENVQRARLWRYLCGDDSVDVAFEGVLTRMGI
ncbi:MAG: phytanoyl-CoA dioxygenase family protein [Chloroflexi bacterium]|nr:phytanoyl-CoA dioxygenase family protein [Chloroflexota bacterium]